MSREQKSVALVLQLELHGSNHHGCFDDASAGTENVVVLAKTKQKKNTKIKSIAVQNIKITNPKLGDQLALVGNKQ